MEIVFATNRTHHVATPPPPLPDIIRVSSLNILRVTVSSRLSVANHVQNVIGSCAQTLHAQRLLREHGLCDSTADSLPSCRRRQVAVRCQRLVGLHHGRRPAAHRGISTPWCACRLPPSGRAVGRPAGRRLDDQLFHRVQYVSGHVLQPLLPDRRTNCYALRDRRHYFLLLCRINSLTDSNFIIRQLFKYSF